jgi:N5-(carboxyethyl)ornithine synthase
MKKGSLIIDISCDRNGGVETSIPTTLTNPIYVVDNIVHYAVDHTPTLFFKTISESLSENIAPYLNQLIDDTPDIVLKDAIAVQNGIIVDQRINQFQGR